MLRLMDNFIKYNLVDMPEKMDSKELKVKTFPERLKILKVLISGANSPFVLPLLFSIAKGYVFGDDTQLIIVIYGFTKHLIRHAKALEAELSMGGFKLLIDVIVSSKPSESFKDIDIAILLETISPPEEFVPVSDENLIVQQYRYLGCALNHHAKKTVKVIFAGGNVNTKALICSLFAPSIPIKNFTGLSCHLATRTSVQIAEICKVSRNTISDVFVWGIGTVDTSFSTITNDTNGEVTNVNEKMNVVQFFLKESEQHKWDNFQLCMVEAIKLHITALISGTKVPISMVIASEGCYDIDPGLFVSLPVTVDDYNNISIKKDLAVHSDVQKHLLLDFDRLKKDRAEILKFVAESKHSKLIRQDFIRHLL